jgi:Putative Actinobacterial Holin-X, holin superfamily III
MRRDDLPTESLVDSVTRLSEEGKAWLRAEVKLARGQLESDGKRISYILAALTIGLAAGFLGLLFVLLWGIAVLAPHVGGLANASGLVGIALCIVTIIVGLIIMSELRRQLGVTSLFKRWLRILRQGPSRK